MANHSLTQPQTTHYTIKEFQLLVKDAPVVPAEIQPFVGVSFRSSRDIYQSFKGLTEMPVESFLVLHLDGKNRIGSMTSSLVHPRDVFRPAIANMTARVSSSSTTTPVAIRLRVRKTSRSQRGKANRDSLSGSRDHW